MMMQYEVLLKFSHNTVKLTTTVYHECAITLHDVPQNIGQRKKSYTLVKIFCTMETTTGGIQLAIQSGYFEDITTKSTCSAEKANLQILQSEDSMQL